MEYLDKSSKNIFKFKKFSIYQGNVPMRLNTDGVLLGCVVNDYLEQFKLGEKRSAEQTNSEQSELERQLISNRLNLYESEGLKVLDIGTGCGVIALIIAQKLSEILKDKFLIDAIDINKECFEVSTLNFNNSPWSENLNSYHSSLQNFTKEQKEKKSFYHLIVSNPPYFNDSLKNPNIEKTNARHTIQLSYKDLIVNSLQLLRDDGLLALIIPSDSKEEFLLLGRRYFLFEKTVIDIYSKPAQINIPKRSIIFFAKGLQKECLHKEIFLESEINGTKSKEYTRLTKEFYL